jgi:hypothetical protein
MALHIDIPADIVCADVPWLPLAMQNSSNLQRLSISISGVEPLGCGLGIIKASLYHSTPSLIRGSPLGVLGFTYGQSVLLH